MIRDAIGADAGRLADIFVAAWRSGYRGVVADEVIDVLDVPSWAATFAEQVRSGRFRTAVWCSDAGAALGFAAFGPDPQLEQPDAGYLTSLYVDPAAASRGIGPALLAHAISELSASGRTRQALWVFAGNQWARQLYERHGFRVTGERLTDPRWAAEQLRYARGPADSS